MRFTAAEPEKSRERLPSASQTYTPSPRTAKGIALTKDRRRTEERSEFRTVPGPGIGSVTCWIIECTKCECQKADDQERGISRIATGLPSLDGIILNPASAG